MSPVTVSHPIYVKPTVCIFPCACLVYKTSSCVHAHKCDIFQIVEYQIVRTVREMAINTNVLLVSMDTTKKDLVQPLNAQVTPFVKHCKNVET